MSLEKVLSVENPYAYFLCSGLKDVENRTWKTDYRGRVLIHSTKYAYSWMDFDDVPKIVQDKIVADNGKRFKELCPEARRWEIMCRHAEKHYRIPEPSALEGLSDEDFFKVINYLVEEYGSPFIYQAIIGSVELVDIIKNSKSPWAVKGQYHWVLQNAVLYDKPILGIKGKQRLWVYDLVA